MQSAVVVMMARRVRIMTSIRHSRSSDQYGYGMEDRSYRRSDNCWTRIGANTCVCILSLSTIILFVALGTVLYKQYKMERLLLLKAPKNGKKFTPVIPQVNPLHIIGNVYDGLRDDEEIFFDDDDSDDDG